MTDQARLTEALAGYLAEFGQRRWYVNERYWERAALAFIHAKKKTPSGAGHEAMVMSRIVKGRVRVRHYVLPDGEDEWLSCDQDAFEGFLTEGLHGLRRGRFKIKPTFCSCGRKVHRSETRANQFARELAQKYGTPKVQRSRRCNQNPRAFHLTIWQKGSSELIPDCLFEPDEAR